MFHVKVELSKEKVPSDYVSLEEINEEYLIYAGIKDKRTIKEGCFYGHTTLELDKNGRLVGVELIIKKDEIKQSKIILEANNLVKGIIFLKEREDFSNKEDEVTYDPANRVLEISFNKMGYHSSSNISATN